nr:palindromic element RPE4 domain-containing protein [Rickettsia endosymbiont of Ixodes scapularis]
MSSRGLTTGSKKQLLTSTFVDLLDPVVKPRDDTEWQ